MVRSIESRTPPQASVLEIKNSSSCFQLSTQTSRFRPGRLTRASSETATWVLTAMTSPQFGLAMYVACTKRWIGAFSPAAIPAFRSRSRMAPSSPGISAPGKSKMFMLSQTARTPTSSGKISRAFVAERVGEARSAARQIKSGLVAFAIWQYRRLTDHELSGSRAQPCYPLARVVGRAAKDIPCCFSGAIHV